MQHEPCPALYDLISVIGVARFVGRINAGIIDPELGYSTLRVWVYDEQHPPGFLKKLWQKLFS